MNGEGDRVGHDVQRSLRARDGHVEHASFLLDVVGQAMGELVGVGLVHDHERPLLALHPVHGGQRDAAGLPRPADRVAQPRLERRAGRAAARPAGRSR